MYNDKNEREKLREYFSRQNLSEKFRERIRFCLSCIWFSTEEEKCAECSCNKETWIGVEKLLNENYKCPKGIW